MKKKVVTLEICTTKTNQEVQDFFEGVCGDYDPDNLDTTQVMVMEIQPPPPE